MTKVKTENQIRNCSSYLADRLRSLVVPETEYCGTARLLGDRKEVYVFGADGAYFFGTESEAIVWSRDPAKARAIFRPIFVERRLLAMVEEFVSRGTFDFTLIFNRAILIWERREMGWKELE